MSSDFYFSNPCGSNSESSEQLAAGVEYVFSERDNLWSECSVIPPAKEKAPKCLEFAARNILIPMPCDSQVYRNKKQILYQYHSTLICGI